MFGVGYVLLFFVFIPLQSWRLVPGLLLSEWVGILGLVVLYARGTGRRLVDVLRLRRAVRARAGGRPLSACRRGLVVGLLAEWIAPRPRRAGRSLRRLIVPPPARGLR